MTIRTLRQEDAQALSVIEKELFSQPWSEEEFQALTKRDYCHYLVAEEDGKIVGCVGMVLLAGEGDVDKVMVDTAYQDRHICLRLFEELFRLGTSLGVEAYTLEVRKGNAKAIHVYEKLGFCIEGVRPGFYDKPREDALIMWKR